MGSEGEFDGEMSFKLDKIRVIEFDTDYINSLKLLVARGKQKQDFAVISKVGALWIGAEDNKKSPLKNPKGK
jgi:hypothetical protein